MSNTSTAPADPEIDITDNDETDMPVGPSAEYKKKSKARVEKFDRNAQDSLRKKQINHNQDNLKAGRDTDPQNLDDKIDKGLTSQFSWRGNENLLTAAELAAEALGAKPTEFMREAIHEAVQNGLGFFPLGSKRQINVSAYQSDLDAIDELSKTTGITKADFVTQALFEKITSMNPEQLRASVENRRAKAEEETQRFSKFISGLEK